MEVVVGAEAVVVLPNDEIVNPVVGFRESVLDVVSVLVTVFVVFGARDDVIEVLSVEVEAVAVPKFTLNPDRVEVPELNVGALVVDDVVEKEKAGILL